MASNTGKKMLKININGTHLMAPEGSTILEAARLAHIEIPTLCFLKNINEIGACRMCVTEVEGSKTLVTSCVYPIFEGMKVRTNTPQVMESRKKNLQLILSDHDRRCLSCVRNEDCELQELCREFQIGEEDAYDGAKNTFEIDYSAPHMYRDNNKCILCRRCTAACEMQVVGVIGANDRGFETYIGSAFNRGLGETSCVACGQCIAVCPTGALYEKDYTAQVFEAIADPEKYVIVEAAPAVRAALGESFGMPIGTDVKGKLAASLRRLGFDRVFDTNFSADVTIMEEGHEFIDRLQNGGVLPLITSCSPGWIKYCEHYFPEMLGHLSTCKSPQQMLGAISKSYFAEKMGLDKEKIVVVSVMPCTAKKFEMTRKDEDGAGVPDVDFVLTTRELASMIKRAGIRFNELPDENFDQPLGLTSGAATIFGATGGVMEAALRTVSEVLTGEELKNPDFVEVRGRQGIKEVTYNIAGMDVKVATASGLGEAKELMNRIKEKGSNYHFVEIMGCPGGCVNGGGQPQQPAGVRNVTDLRSRRAKVLYTEDKASVIRKSHENFAVQLLYKEYLEAPGSHKAHQLLHTSYIKRRVNER